MPLRSPFFALAIASLIACAPIGAFPLPSLTDEPCPPLAAAARPTAVVDPHPIPPKVVALLSPVSATSQIRDLHGAIAAALEHRGFSTRTLTLDRADESSPSSCTETDDLRVCLATIATWLLRRREPTTDLILYARYTPGRPTLATFVLHDIARRDITYTLDVALAEGDLIAPLVLPTALADALADRVAAPPPITDEERWILETIDEPPFRAADQFCRPRD